MNERIRELAEHCDFYVGNEHYDKSHEEQQRLFMEKFAELIVRECAQYIEDKFDFCGDELIIAEKLKEHFGVEE
jgi:hypothetical protein